MLRWLRSVIALASGERRWLLFVLALAAGLALDLGSKGWAFAALRDAGGSTDLTSFFSFRLATNEGGAFGLLRGRFDVFFAVAVVALAGLPYFVHSAPPRAVALPLVVGLTLAGVIGNFWDRAVHGHVRDFLDLHAGGHHWPTFNVADVFINAGAVTLVLVRRDGPPALSARPSPPPASCAPPPPS